MSRFLDILKAIQLPPRFLFAATGLGLLFLLMPAPLAQWLRIQGALEDGRGWIALGTACAFVFGTAQLAPLLLRMIQRKLAIREYIRSLDSLSGGERILLGYCAYRRKRTVLLSLDSTAGNIAGGLCQKGLLEQADGSHNILAWPFSIPAFLWPQITKRIRSILGPDWENDEEILKEFTRLDRQTSGRERTIY